MHKKKEGKKEKEIGTEKNKRYVEGREKDKMKEIIRGMGGKMCPNCTVQYSSDTTQW